MKRCIVRHGFALAAVLFAVATIFGQTDRGATKNPSSPAEPRTALVIGNSDYRGARRIPTAVGDAREVATTLESLGFEVFKGENLSAIRMKKLAGDFVRALARKKGVGLVFFSGYGVQVNGKNYLVPVESRTLDSITVSIQTLDVSKLFDWMRIAGNRLNVVIIDAGRGSSIKITGTNSSAGLAEIKAPEGVAVAFSAEAGKLIPDGDAKQNVFTTEFLKLIRTPDLPIGDLLKQVSDRVSAETSGAQIPYLSIAPRGSFSFVATKNEPVPQPDAQTSSPKPDADSGKTSSTPPVRSGTQQQTPKDDSQSGKKNEEPPTPPSAEGIYWSEVRQRNTIRGYELYLSEYPAGMYSVIAKTAIKELETAEEKKIWESAKSSGEKSGYLAYLKTYPQGAFSAQAREKIKEIEKSEDAAKWQSAEQLKTVAAYQDYLKEFPKGEFASLARFRLLEQGVRSAGMPWKNSMGIEFVWIPPGDFMIGSPADERQRGNDEGPQKKVTIAQGFWMGKFEVTQGQWVQVMGTNPSKFTSCGLNCPVESVSWDDIQEFLTKLNAKDDGYVYSLPSEALWEYAARAGAKTPFAFGDQLSSTQANFDGKYPYNRAPSGSFLQMTSPVGRYEANAWGLFDVHGNVWEWVQDVYSTEGYANLASDGSANTTRGNVSQRVYRGGSWYEGGDGLRFAKRGGAGQSIRYTNCGFRILARPK